QRTLHELRARNEGDKAVDLAITDPRDRLLDDARPRRATVHGTVADPDEVSRERAVTLDHRRQRLQRRLFVSQPPIQLGERAGPRRKTARYGENRFAGEQPRGWHGGDGIAALGNAQSKRP